MGREYILLSGEKFEINKLNKEEKGVVKEFLKRTRKDPEGDDEGEYFLLYRLLCGPEALLEKYRNSLTPRTMREPCYLILRDIVARTSIRHGIMPDKETEEKLRCYNPMCTAHCLMTAPNELGMKRSEVVRLLERGELSGARIGNVWFVYEVSIQDYKKRLENGKKK